MDAGPIGKRRSGEHDGADLFRVNRGHHHDLPAGLAVADQAGLTFSIGVKLDYFLDKAGFGFAYVLNCLAGYRIGQKPDEIARVAGGERHRFYLW